MFRNGLAAGIGFIVSCGSRMELRSDLAGVAATGGATGEGTTIYWSGSSPGTGATGTGTNGAGITIDAGNEAWIAFDSDPNQNRDIYVVRADGSDLRRLTTETSSDMEPAFSRDGRLLAFASDRSNVVMQIHLLDLATGIPSYGRG